jgi:Zn-dependent protease
LHLLSFLVPFLIVLVALTIHEAAHAWTADRLGDPTARLLGRISLNPVRHIDPVGTILLPIVAALTNFPIIGWAKPVPVNVRQLRRGPRDFTLVAAAGPISNIFQAVAAAVLLRTFVGETGLTATILAYAVQINLLLAFFNLIPVPPLDGGNVLAGLLPRQAAAVLDMLRTYGFVVLYALMLSGALARIILPPTLFFQRILLP